MGGPGRKPRTRRTCSAFLVDRKPCSILSFPITYSSSNGHSLSYIASACATSLSSSPYATAQQMASLTLQRANLSVHSRRGVVSRRGSVQVCAKTTSGRITGRAPKLSDPVDPNAVGFRFDPANNRWLRDDKYAGKWDESLTTAVPKSGSPYVVWPIMHTQLVSKGLRSVTPEEALELQGQGWTIVDVRLAGDFEKVRAEGAISLPLYRYVEGTSFWDNVKKAAMAVGFAMRATERDPDYRNKALATLQKNQKIILMCAIGGTLDTLVDLRKGVKPAIRDPERAFGRESRSLKAAYELLQVGWSGSNMFWVEGGLQQWRYRGLPTEGGDA